MPLPKITLSTRELSAIEGRFWAQVTKQGPSECWPWTGPLNKQGYGRISYKGDDGQHRRARAHRVAYELVVGPIPDGLALDHTCHDPEVCQLGDLCPHRACCNPAHHQPGTLSTNAARGRTTSGQAQLARTHCPKGHEYTNENTKTRTNNGYTKRYCIACERARFPAMAKARSEKRAALRASR